MLPLASDADVYGSVVRGLLRREPGLDLVRVQDVGLRIAPDSLILEAYARVIAGLSMPGVIAVRKSTNIGRIIEDILIVAWCSTEDEMKDRVIFVPL